MRTWLRALRKSKGLRQEDLSILIGCTRQQYNHIETGKRVKLSLQAAAKLSETFNLELGEILFYENITDSNIDINEQDCINT